MIPKVFHQIWIGPKPLPDNCREWSKTLLQVNPEYEHVWHGNEDLERYRSKDPVIDTLVAEGFDWAMVSNRMRLLVVYEFGGWHLDADVSALRPVSNLVDRYKGFDVGMCAVPADTCIMFAKPQAPLIQRCLDTNPGDAGYSAAWMVKHAIPGELARIHHNFWELRIPNRKSLFAHRGHMLRSWVPVRPSDENGAPMRTWAEIRERLRAERNRLANTKAI